MSVISGSSSSSLGSSLVVLVLVKRLVILRTLSRVPSRIARFVSCMRSTTSPAICLEALLRCLTRLEKVLVLLLLLEELSSEVLEELDSFEFLRTIGTEVLGFGIGFLTSKLMLLGAGIGALISTVSTFLRFRFVIDRCHLS